MPPAATQICTTNYEYLDATRVGTSTQVCYRTLEVWGIYAIDGLFVFGVFFLAILLFKKNRTIIFK